MQGSDVKYYPILNYKVSKIYSKTAKLWKSGAALQSLGEKSWEIKGIAAKNGCNDVNANKF